MKIHNKNRNKKVLFICSGQKWYTRNNHIISLLNKQYNLDIITSTNKTYLSRVISVLYQFFLIKNKKKYDFIYVGFVSQILIPFIKIFYSGRLIGDYFISMHDTICTDRKTINTKSILGKSIFQLEKWTLNKTDCIIVDTYSNKNYFEKYFNYNKNKIKVIYVLADKKLFYPRKDNNAPQNKNFEVFFYGSGQPLHGVDTILKAAKLLENKNIAFTLIGPIKKKYGGLIKKLNLSNVKFIDWVDYKKLPEYIAKADVCLGGHFSDTEKAKRVIAGKTFQFAAMQKPIILGDNKANKEIFTNKKNCLMVKMNNELLLSDAIKQLMENNHLRKNIAKNARGAILNVKYNKLI